MFFFSLVLFMENRPESSKNDKKIYNELQKPYKELQNTYIYIYMYTKNDKNNVKNSKKHI